jgi:hypothetical protein
VESHYNYTKRPQSAEGMHNSTLSILQVCRQVREEALALVLNTSLLAFSTYYESTAFLKHVDPVKADTDMRAASIHQGKGGINIQGIW